MASTMAQATARQTLGVAEDTMEISSDAGGNHDNDIDIDIDFYDGAQAPQDDYMEDQGDDLMVDDDLPDREHGDGLMQDVDVEDEELHDVDVDGDGDTEIIHEHATSVPQPAPNPSLLGASLENAFLEQPENIVEQLPTPGNENVTIQFSAAENYDNSTNIDVVGNQPEDVSPLNELTSLNEETKTASRRQSGDNTSQQLNPNLNDNLSSVEVPELFEEKQENAEAQVVEPSVTELQPSINLEETTAADEIQTTEPLIHPIMLSWKGQESLLFPFQRDHDSYFANTLLLNEKFRRLFNELRQSLEGDIEEESKLELEIEALSLTISEDSSEINDNSLGDVLDIYQTLCHNDGKENPGTLFILLHEKVPFLRRLERLHECISNDLGLSQVQPQFYESYSEHEGDEANEDAEQGSNPEDLGQTQDLTSAAQSTPREGKVEPKEQAIDIKSKDRVAYDDIDKEKNAQGAQLEEKVAEHTQHREDLPANQTNTESKNSPHDQDADYNDDIIDYSDEEEGNLETDDHKEELHFKEHSYEDTTGVSLPSESEQQVATNTSEPAHDQAATEEETFAQGDDGTAAIQSYTELHEGNPTNEDDDNLYIEDEENLDVLGHEEAVHAEDPEDEWRLEDEDETTFHSAVNDALELSEAGLATDQIDFEQDLHSDENGQDGADEFELFNGDIGDDLNEEDNPTEDFLEYDAEENSFDGDEANTGEIEAKEQISATSPNEQLSATASKKRSRRDQEDEQDGENGLSSASKKARPD